jgi:hypothetical protein
MRITRLTAAALAAGMLLAVGCAKPGPSEQAISTADYALKAAREQGADQESAALMRSAEEKLSRARALHKKKDFEESERLAAQVAVEAQLADAITRNNIAKARLADSEKVLEELRTEAERRRQY